MLTLMLMLATPAYTVPPGLAGVAGLHGCWRVSGQVQGKDSPSIARGEWHLGRRYFTLHLRATGSDPYEAAITYGAGAKPQAIGSVFSDTFGGLYEPSLGLGELEQNGFVQRYRFSDATYVIGSAAPALAGVGPSPRRSRISRLRSLRTITCARLHVAE